MGSFWKAVNEVIEKSDIVLEILDARFVDETRNAEIEKKVLCRGKKIIYVINKCDLVPKEQSEKKKKELKPSVFISAKDHLGTTMLRKLILETAKKESVVVGVVGYPNTGKSSVINALAGREKAKTSSVSGYTRGIQAVRADKRLSLLDTPGVIPFMEEDEFLHAVIGAKDSSKVREPDYIVMRLMENAHGTVEKHYGVQEAEDPEQGLEKIAIRLNMLMKGGVPDVEKASRKILSDWQKGEINLSR